MIHSTHHDHLKIDCFFSRSPSHTAKLRGWGDNIVVRAVVKSKIGELEKEVREGRSRMMRNDFDWCGASSIGEEKVLGDFSVWVKK